MSMDDRENGGAGPPVGDGLYASLLDSCEFGMIVIGADGLVFFWNAWMVTASGKSSAEICGKRLEECFPDLAGSRITAAVETALKDGMPSVLSPRLNKTPLPLKKQNVGSQAGQPIDQSITVKPIRNKGKEPCCLIQITDVSAVTQREKMLRKMAHDTRRQRDELASLNRDKDRFFSIIAHDLKGPFNALLGLSRILSSDSEKIGPQKVARYSTALHFSAKELFKLLENLLDWSLIQMGRMEYNPIALTPAILAHDCVNLLAPTAVSKGVRLDLKDLGCGKLHADAHMTATILRNIVGNAVKFTPSGGKVEISFAEQDAMALFSVRDTGLGMPQARVDRLLDSDRKETTEGTNGETGSGLGIHLCKELIGIQGGVFSIESTEGQGSVFSFSLPLVNAP